MYYCLVVELECAMGLMPRLVAGYCPELVPSIFHVHRLFAIQ